MSLKNIITSFFLIMLLRKTIAEKLSEDNPNKHFTNLFNFLKQKTPGLLQEGKKIDGTYRVTKSLTNEKVNRIYYTFSITNTNCSKIKFSIIEDENIENNETLKKEMENCVRESETPIENDFEVFSTETFSKNDKNDNYNEVETAIEQIKEGFLQYREIENGKRIESMRKNTENNDEFKIVIEFNTTGELECHFKVVLYFQDTLENSQNFKNQIADCEEKEKNSNMYNKAIGAKKIFDLNIEEFDQDKEFTEQDKGSLYII